MATMGAVGKGGTAEYGEKFAYHKIDDIDEKLRGALVEHGVTCTIVEISDRKLQYYEKEDKWKNLKITWYAECFITIELVNADDPSDRTRIVGWGQGLDSSDKATGKAISYAAKSAYLSAFHLRGQPDNEESDHAPPPPANSPVAKSETKTATTKAAKAAVTKPVEVVVLPDFDSLSADAQTWVSACRSCDDMEMLRGFQKNLAQESEPLKQAVTPFVEEQKKVCWAFEINASKTIPELNAVGKAIADDGNKSLHTALHAVYGAKVKSLKEGLKEKKNDN